VKLPTWSKALQRSVGAKIRSVRQEVGRRGLTQSALSDRTNGAVSRSSIANIERGRQGVSLEQLYLLAEALVVEPSDLLPPRAQILVSEDVRGASLRDSMGPEERKWLDRLSDQATTKRQGRRGA